MPDTFLPVIRTLAGLLDHVRAQWERGQCRVIGVAGAPGAGKTRLVEAVLEEMRADLPGGSMAKLAHVPGDGFHLADAELRRLGRLDRKGAPDTFDPAGYAALLRRIRDNHDRDEAVYAPAFDRQLEQPLAGAIAVSSRSELVLTESNYLLLDEEPWAAVRAQLDEVWFVEIDDDERRRRLVERHVRFGKSRAAAEAWVVDVDEPNAHRVAASRCHADVLVAGSAMDVR
jgi:pantothenate kinase